MKLFLCMAFAGLLALSGCGITYEDEMRRLTTRATPFDICVAAGDTRMGSEERRKAGLTLMQRQGIQCDWNAVGMYYQNQRNAAMANTPAVMQMLNQNLGYQTPPAFQGSASPAGNYNSLTGTTVHQNGAITQQGAGNLVSQSTMNGMRYCYYNKLGSITSIAISTTQMCPLSN